MNKRFCGVPLRALAVSGLALDLLFSLMIIIVDAFSNNLRQIILSSIAIFIILFGLLSTYIVFHMIIQ